MDCGYRACRWPFRISEAISRGAETAPKILADPPPPGQESGAFLFASAHGAGHTLGMNQRLRDLATITWRNDELRRAYDQALAARQQALAG